MMIDINILLNIPHLNYILLTEKNMDIKENEK